MPSSRLIRALLYLFLYSSKESSLTEFIGATPQIDKRYRFNFCGFRSLCCLQQFVSIFSALRNHFVPRSNHLIFQVHPHRLTTLAEGEGCGGHDLKIDLTTAIGYVLCV
jgi:hypothetical protein